MIAVFIFLSVMALFSGFEIHKKCKKQGVEFNPLSGNFIEFIIFLLSVSIIIGITFAYIISFLFTIKLDL